jgi:hypothetical protein
MPSSGAFVVATITVLVLLFVSLVRRPSSTSCEA